MSLKKARDKRDDARKLIADGIDPMEIRKTGKTHDLDSAANSFKALTLEWYAKQKPHWSDSHSERTLRILEKDLFPRLGHSPIASITAPKLLAALRPVEARGAIETANRLKQVAGQIFRYAIATGRAERDPSPDLKGALATPKTMHLVHCNK